MWYWCPVVTRIAMGFTTGCGGEHGTLGQMARATGGRVYDARTGEVLAAAYAAMGALGRSRSGEREFALCREFAPWVAAAALALLVVDAALRASWLRRHP